MRDQMDYQIRYLLLGLSYGIDQFEAGMVPFDAGNLALYALSAPLAAMSVIAPTVALRSLGRMPGWLIAIGVAEVALNVAEVAGLFARTGADAAGYALGLGPLVWGVWVLGLVVTLQ